jgi:hypothetical protein
MKVCLHCGRENADHNQFCIECGTPFMRQVEHPRTSITENIRFAFKLAGSNTKVFYPTIITFVGGLVLVIVMFLSIGISFSEYNPDTVPTTQPVGGLIFFILLLTGSYLGIVSIPTFQHVYKNAVQGVEINLRESFKYGRSRFLSYLKAFLLLGVIFMVIMFSAMALTLYPLLENVPSDMVTLDEFNYMILFRMVPLFFILIPLMAVYYLSFMVMAFENVGIISALRLSYNYFRNRLKDLVILFVLSMVFSLVLMMIPLIGWIAGYGLTVVYNLALIDNYQNYKTTEMTGNLATGLE